MEDSREAFLGNDESLGVDVGGGLTVGLSQPWEPGDLADFLPKIEAGELGDVSWRKRPSGSEALEVGRF